MIEVIDEAIANGATAKSACETAGITVRTLQRWRCNPAGDKRRGPNKRPASSLSQTERDKIIEVSSSLEFADLSPHQVVAKLADMDIYIASESSFYRELRRAKMLAHRHRSQPRKNKKPSELVAEVPNQVWSWDITYLPGPVVGTFFFLYAVVDVWSRKIIASEVHRLQDDSLSAAMIQAACEREGITRSKLTLHADNGSAMKGKTMLAKLEQLGVAPSFSRPRVSDDNPFSESLFRTMKYRPSYPDGRFKDLADAQRWVDEFVRWYNVDHQHSAIRFVTPSQRHDGREHGILERRHQLYIKARQKAPQRWSGPTRNWTPVLQVHMHAPRLGAAANSARHASQALPVRA